jgi:hypothetical protein
VDRPLSFAIALACLLAAPIASAGYTWKLPKFSRQIPAGEAVVSVEVGVDCLSVTDVRSVPDGWNLSLRADGENYHLRLERTESEAWLVKLGTQEREASNARVQQFTFRTEPRGQWSDCGGVSLRAHTRSANGSFVYSYRNDDSGWELAERKPE